MGSAIYPPMRFQVLHVYKVEASLSASLSAKLMSATVAELFYVILTAWRSWAVTSFDVNQLAAMGCFWTSRAIVNRISVAGRWVRSYLSPHTQSRSWHDMKNTRPTRP